MLNICSSLKLECVSFLLFMWQIFETKAPDLMYDFDLIWSPRSSSQFLHNIPCKP